MIKLCAASDVPQGRGLRIVLPGFEPIAVFFTGTEYFATADECTHGSASLADGEIVGEDIECPFHRGAFNLRTGAVTAAPCIEPIRTYRIVVQDGDIYLLQDPPD